MATVPFNAYGVRVEPVSTSDGEVWIVLRLDGQFAELDTDQAGELGHALWEWARKENVRRLRTNPPPRPGVRRDRR